MATDTISYMMITH